jgi:CheY-like chemotaxis protein
MSEKKIGERLVDAGLVSAEAVESALQQQTITGRLLGECLIDLGLIEDAPLLRFLAAQFETRFVTAEKMAKAKIAPEVLDKLPVRIAEQQAVLPLAIDQESQVISVVMAEPQDQKLLEEIKIVTKMEEVYAYVGIRSAVLAGVKKHYYGDPTAFAALEAGGGARALKADTANMGKAEGPNEPSRVSPTPMSVVLSDKSAISRLSQTSGRINPTQLREALGAVRSTIGENDYVETLNILVGLLEMPRKDFRGHSAQVARQSTAIARRMGLQPREVASIQIAAYLHDLGKKPEKHFTLSALEGSTELRAEAKRYVRAPVKLFETVHLSTQVNAVLAQVYEAYDGSGVPQGVKGEDIAAGARIIAAVDDFLDLTKNPQNPFSRVFTKQEALDHLRERAGKLYDPAVVDALETLQSGDLLRQRLECEGRQIVVADPDEGVRTDLQDALNKLGLVSQLVPKLDGVVEAVAANDADVICVGLSYGANDIIALTQFVRTRAETASMPIVVLGTPTEAAQKDKLQTAGVTNFLPTPLEPDEAGSIIRGLYIDHIEHGSPGRQVKGSFDELASTEIARLLGRGRKSGKLVVRSGNHEGHLMLEKGKVMFATWAGKSGEEAVKQLLAQPQADFAFDPEAQLVEMPNIDKDFEVLLKGMKPTAARAED